MDFEELEELHYITPIENLASIFQHGILSHKMIKNRKIQSASIAMQEIQDERSRKSVPNARALHDYANLYICARNPMMYKRRGQHRNISVLGVSPEVLHLANVVISDGNAASKYTAFYPAPGGLKYIDKDLVFLEDWTDPDKIEYWRKKSAKCSEVLVPDLVDPQYIQVCYVSCTESAEAASALGLSVPLNVHPHLFFQT